MRDSRDPLLDDWPVVENFRNVVRRGANQFHAALVSLQMRLRSDKRWQERVMNIDDLLGVECNEFRRKNLHVTRENNQVDFVMLK